MDLFAQLEQKNNLPSGLLDAVWQAESSRGQDMQSPKGAQGHFQFMPATAEQYGVSDPNNLQQSAAGAAKMLSDMVQQTGSVPGALAAYNWGIGNVQRKGMQAAPEETRNYIQKVTANMSQQPSQDDPWAALGQQFSQGAPAKAPVQDDEWGALAKQFSQPVPAAAQPAQAPAQQPVGAPAPQEMPTPQPGSLQLAGGESAPVTSPQAGRYGTLLSRLPIDAGKGLGHDLNNMLQGALVGAGSIGATLVAPYDIIQDYRAGKGLSLESNKQRREDTELAAKYIFNADPESVAFEGGKLGAQVAGTAGAGGLVAKGLEMLPYAAKIAPLIDSIGSSGFRVGGLEGAPALATRMVGGAINGGLSAGLVDPETAGTGAVIGGVLPGATQVIGGLGGMADKGLRSLAEPLYDSGRDQIIGRALKEFSGASADDAIRNLMNAKSLVPGSSPTVAEAAGVPSLAALQRASINVSPEAANTLAERAAANNQARINALEEIAGSPEARRTAQDARDDFANVFYNTAKNSDNMRQDQIAMQAIDPRTPWMSELGIGKAPVSPIKPSDELKELAARPAMKSFIKNAKDMAENSGEQIGDPLTSITGLHYIKLAMDDALTANPLTAMARNEKRNVMGMKEMLTDEMDKLSPLYSLARENFQTASKPLNQMDVAQALLGTVNPLNGNLRAFQYANKLNDKTVATATGFKGSTLENTMTPEQLQTLNNLKDDLTRADFGANAGRPVGTNTIQNLSYSNMLNQSGIPNALRSSAVGQVAGGLLGKAADVVYGKANKEIAGRLAQVMMDPLEAAKLMMYKKQPNTKLLNAVQQGLLSTSKVAPVLISQ